MQRKLQQVLSRRHSDAGMTLIELSIVMMIMAIVMAMAGAVLISLTQSATRTDARITDEQEASTVLAQVSRDIRSAHKVTFAAFSSPVPGDEIELQMNQPANTWLEWIYTPTAATVNGVAQPAHTLARYLATSPTGPFKPSAPSVATPVNVANGTNNLFEYYYLGGQIVTNTTYTSTIETCATRVSVILQVATGKNLTAVPTFTVRDDVAITDQEAQWQTLPCSNV